MRERSMTALAAVMLLAGGIWGGAANAVPLAPSSVGAMAADRGVVEKAAVICGYYGCVRTYPRYWGYPYYYGYRPYPYRYYRPYWYR